VQCDVAGRRIRLTLVAPHFDEQILPTLSGRLGRSVPGYFGVLRYLVELDAPLPPGFDPLGELPWFARGRSVRHLVVTPAPDAPTLKTPPDVIARTVQGDGIVHVFVSVGPTARALRAPDLHASVARCPFLCMGDLQADQDPARP
jgi:hypothetical protein